MMEFLSFLGSIAAGLGFGSLLSTWLIQYWEKKKLIYQTKLNAYSAFIQGYQECVSKPQDEILKQLFVSHQKQVELVSPQEIVILSRKIL